MNSRHQNLDGRWNLAADPSDEGLARGWHASAPVESVAVPVPGIIQQVLPGCHGIVWYWHGFHAGIARPLGGMYLLRFGAVDYSARVWLNGVFLGSHEGGETPFLLDATGAIKEDGDNFLAVRVLNPTDERIDGVTLAETPHRHKFNHMLPGLCYNYGGIWGSVELLVKPELWISDLYIRAEPGTGFVKAEVRLQGGLGNGASCALALEVRRGEHGPVVSSASRGCPHRRDGNVFAIEARVDDLRLWSLEDPFLYFVEVRLERSSAGAGVTEDETATIDRAGTSCGFREFRVDKGFFRLNGVRIFLKSTHTGNHFPISWIIPQDPDLMRRDLVNAKACGFNIVRFIAGIALPEQLDFCDRIGLLVYEECNASWHFAKSYLGDPAGQLPDSPEIRKRFENSCEEMVLRDRNHPSLVAWGLLNETYDGPVFRTAVAWLGRLRILDQTRFVFLNSGRFDKALDIGSYSNPGSDAWEYGWGEERQSHAPAPADWDTIPAVVAGAGDVHAYPVQPQSKGDEDRIRTLGQSGKPVFLSEYGVASQTDAIGALRMYESLGTRQDLVEVELYRGMAEKVHADFEAFGLGSVFAFPGDMLVASQVANAKERLRGFDTVRSNPGICGYNFTGMLDHAATGEGAWDFWRVWKPGYCDALSDGWSKLRWCLFASAEHVYRGANLNLEAVLANEDLLPPGHYPARFRLLGPQGLVWEKSADIVLPESWKGGAPPFATSVLDIELQADWPAGEYQFAASLLSGGKAAGGRKQLTVSERHAFRGDRGKLLTAALPDSARAWLEGLGFICQEADEGSLSQCSIPILVGKPMGEGGASLCRFILEAVGRGCMALFLDSAVFDRDGGLGGLGVPATLVRFYDSVYHKDCVSKPHPFFAGLAKAGIMDAAYYGSLISHGFFECMRPPEDTAAFAFAAGYLRETGYASGLLLGGFDHGQGRYYLNAFNVLGRLGLEPSADRLLLNAIAHVRSLPGAPSGRSPSPASAVIKECTTSPKSDDFLALFTGKKDS